MNIYMYFYVDNKGKVIQRLAKRRLFKIGEINGLGWVLIDVKVLYNGKFVSYDTYDSLRYSCSRKKKKNFFNIFILKKVFRY